MLVAQSNLYAMAHDAVGKAQTPRLPTECMVVRPAIQPEPAQAPLRVLVVSNVRLFREGVSSVLARQGGIRVVGAADVPHAQVRTSELQPDVVMLDATSRESVEHARNLAALAPNTRIVAFGVAETQQEEILALAAAGTAGYVRDDAEAKDVVGALTRVMRDELLCSPQATASLYHQVALLSHEQNGHEQNGAPSIELLSRREQQIACLIDRGLSNKQIARELGIQATTVKNHVHHICDKLKVHRRGEAVARVRTSLRSPAVSLSGDPTLPLPGSRPRSR